MTRARLIQLAAIALACAAWMSSATAQAVGPSTINGAASCTKFPEVSPGVHIQTFDATDVTGGIAGLPDRVTTDFAPGDSGRICVGFHNRTGEDVTLRFATHDVGASAEGSPVPFATGEEQYGAGTWLTLPEAKSVTIEHGELVWLDVGVDVPEDTSGGSAYAGVSALVTSAEIEGGDSGTQTKITPSVVVQVFFDVPGDITDGGHVQKVRSPRVVWWDGLSIGDVPGLDRLRGQGIAPVRFEWSNDGSVTDTISGSLKLESSLGGRDVASIDIPERVVLRDSDRPITVTWSKDIPFIGRFEPTLVLKRANGEVVEKELPAIWVIPSWWYFVLLAIAIALPLWWRRRSRRRYDELLARVEAAEASGGRDADDEDWDEPSDRWT